MGYKDIRSWLKPKVSNHSQFQGWLALDTEISGLTGKTPWDPSAGWEGGWRKSPKWESDIPRLSIVLCWADLLYEIKWRTQKEGQGRGLEKRRGILCSFIFKFYLIIKMSVSSNVGLGKVPTEKLGWIADLESHYMNNGLTKPAYSLPPTWACTMQIIP